MTGGGGFVTALRGISGESCIIVRGSYFIPVMIFSVTSVAIIIIDMTMFIVLLSWHNHCESSSGSFNECSATRLLDEET